MGKKIVLLILVLALVAGSCFATAAGAEGQDHYQGEE